MLFPKNEHDELCLRGEKWLASNGCKVIIRDPFRCPANREQPDVIGWRDSISIVVEVKTTRSDFHKDKAKIFRQNGDGMGDWRFFLCPPKLITIDDLPEGWGLLWATPKLIKKVHGVPPNTRWHRSKPFTGNKLNENKLLVSAMRRFFIRNLQEAMYLPYGENIENPQKIEYNGMAVRNNGLVNGH